MQHFVNSKIYAAGDWIDQPQKVCSGLERARDYARKLIIEAVMPTKAQVCVGDAESFREDHKFERDAEGHLSGL